MPFGLPALALTDIKESLDLQRTLPDSQVGDWDTLEREWFGRSAKAFVTQAMQPVGAGLSGTNLSLNQFIAKYPNFAWQWENYWAASPTNDEKTKGNGTLKYIQRGHTLLYKPVFSGVQSIAEFGAHACLTWCRGCTNSVWPEGIPTCLETVGLGKWEIFVRRDPGNKITYRINPQEKTLVQNVLGGLFWLVKQPLKLINAICKNQQYVAAGAGADPKLQAAAAALSLVCRSGNVGGEPAGPPATQTFPPGSIGYVKAEGVLVAVPTGAAASWTQPTHRPDKMMTALPPGVNQVNFWQWDRATKPWYSRTSTLIAAGATATTFLAVGMAVRSRRAA